MDTTDLIREARKALGWSQQQAADAAGLTVQHWGQVERGKERGGDKALASMALALKITPEQLEQVERDGAADELRRLIDERGALVPSTDADDIVMLQRILTKLTQDEVRWFVRHADLFSRLHVSESTATDAHADDAGSADTGADKTRARRAG